MSFQLSYETHERLLKNLKDSLETMLNISSGDRELRVVSIDLPNYQRTDDLKAQKTAKITGKSYDLPIKGTLELVEKGKVINRATIKLLDVPQVTQRGTYIVGGNEYSFPLQKRLIPGVYTKEHNDGKISAWMNSSKGRNITISLRPGGDFVMELEGVIINLFAILLGLGVKEPQLVRLWGKEVYDNNKAARGARDYLTALKKLYSKLHYPGDPDVQGDGINAYANWITQYFKEKSSFDPDNVAISLGQKFSHTSAALILAITGKILEISKGTATEDNKESLIHNNIFDLSDFAIERLNQRQYQGRIQRALTRNLSRYDKVAEIVQKDIFQSPLESTFTQTNLAKIPKQTNPMDQAASFSEITVMGEGGIQSMHAVTADVRALDPSHLGFIDPAQTPEGSNIGTTLHLASGARKVGKDLVNGFFNVKTGKVEDLNSRQAYAAYITFPENYKNGKLKADDDGLVKATYMGEMQRVKPSKVQYALKKSTSLVGVNTMAIPFLAHNNGTRVMTAAKMQAQAKPLKHREKPMIQSAVNESTNETIEDVVGKNSIPRSPVDGVVKKIERDEVIIEDSRGVAHPVGIPRDFWMNENNYTDTELSVQVGDKVKKGQPLGDTNYTKDGTLALGTNLRVAYVNYKGYNHEDGVVISETAAEKLTSLHAYQQTVPFQDDEIIDKEKFVAYFPAIYSRDQIEGIDSNGVIKVGAKLKKGDPMVLKLRKVEEDALSKKLQNISRLLTQDFRDTSYTWDKSTVGEVAEVHVRSKDVMIVVKTEERAKLGDKLCFDEETEVLTSTGWKPVADVSLEDKVATLSGNDLEWNNPTDLHRYDRGGRMYKLQTQQLDVLVTEDHHNYVSRPGSGEFCHMAARDCFGRGLDYLSWGGRAISSSEIIVEEWVENYDRPVYCLTVPNHVLYVRRNGKAYFSGNCGRYGNKGTITTILPDKEMPKDEKGNAMELLLDPGSVPGRMNIGQILETTASRVAEKEGRTYVAKPFGENSTEVLSKELKKKGLKDHGKLIDGDREINGVLTGLQYTIKLEHQVEKKLSARGAGPGYSYSSHGQPSRGSGESGRAVGLGEMYALLAQGANANLAEMYTFKGDKQLEVWRAIENGTMVPPPEMPASSERFVNMLRGMGVDLVEGDNMVKMVPFLDKDVAKVSNGKIKDATVLRAKDLKEEKGGLFDFRTTGGIIGDKWSHVELAEPMPHPTFEKSILAVTGLKQKDIDLIMTSKKGVLDGKLVDADAPGALQGGEAIKSLLKKVDPNARIKELEATAPKLKGSDLNRAHLELRVLRNFKDNGIPLDSMVVTKMPILPPKFRPVTEMPNGDLAIADVNEHYRAAIMMNNHLEQLKGRPGLRDEARAARASLYEGVRGVMGNSQGLVEKPDVKGLGRTIAGNQPKTGYFQSRLLKRRQEVSGTAVIGPEPKLKLDEIGIPENMAWEVFQPFVIKNLKSQGLTSMAARHEIENRTQFAKSALMTTMESRHVLANRAPTLHKGSFVAFKPKLISGSAVRVSVENYSGFNADNDGDTFGIHVPVTDEANAEAANMLPSNNLFRVGTNREKIAPELGKEYMMGLFKLTRNGRTTSKSYQLPEHALRDAKIKKIRWDDIISVRRIGRTTAGKIRVMDKVPEKYRDYQMTLTAGEQKKFLAMLAKEGAKKDLLEVIEDWKHAGRIHVYETGTSLLLSDLQSLSKERKSLYRTADQQAAKVRQDTKLSKEEKEKRIIEIYSKVDSKIIGMAVKLPNNDSGQTNNIADMVNSGMSKPGKSQIKQLVGTVGLMMNHKNEIMTEPVRGNYSEGLSSSEFFSHMYAQRKGMIDKSQSVSGPGMLSKELTNTATTQKVTTVDCGTQNGRMENIDRNLIDRVLLTPVAGLPANSVIDDSALEKIKKSNVPKVKVRSILTCQAAAGICAKCFGIDEFGKFPNIGQNVGIAEIQTITERSVQLPMKNFHSGGVASGSAASVNNAFDRAMQLFRMPETIRDKAILAEVSGAVVSITKSGYGGSVVTIGSKQHRVPKGRSLSVKVGDLVKKGDKITDGVTKPQELLKLRGMTSVQDQMCHDLNETFQSAGVNLGKRTYEVPVKMLTEQVRITDPGDNKGFVSGDYSTIGKVDSWNRANPGKKPIKYNNILPGSLMAPQYTEDFARRMALGRIQQAITDGAGMGFASERKGVSPFVDLALGPGTKIKPAGQR